MTSTFTEEVVQSTMSDDPDESAHIVLPPPDAPDVTPQAYVLRARIEGFPIVAVCGHEFIPVRNPEPLPVCQPCMDFFQSHGSDLDDRKGPPQA